MTARGFLIGLVIVALEGCAKAPPPPRFLTEASRSYDQDRATTRSRILAYLESRRMTVREDPDGGPIEAELEYTGPDDWATCGTAEGPPRIDRPRALSRRVSLAITIRGDDARSEVDLVAEFTERQVERLTNIQSDRPCRSTGVIEAEVLDAPLQPAPPDRG